MVNFYLTHMFHCLLLLLVFLSVSYLSPAHSSSLLAPIILPLGRNKSDSGLFLITNDARRSLCMTDGSRRPDLAFYLIINTRATVVQAANYGGGSINSPSLCLPLLARHHLAPTALLTGRLLVWECVR